MLIGSLRNKVSKARLRFRSFGASPLSHRQMDFHRLKIRIRKIIILVSIHSLLDRALNKLSNASNRTQFGVTVLNLWRKQDFTFAVSPLSGGGALSGAPVEKIRV